MHLSGPTIEGALEQLTDHQPGGPTVGETTGADFEQRLRAEVRLATQGRRHASDGLSYLQVAVGGMQKITSLLSRAAKLAEQVPGGGPGTGSAGPTGAGQAPSVLDEDYRDILTLIDEINANTRFNGEVVFGSELGIVMGDHLRVTVAVGPVGSLDLMGEPGAAAGSVTDPGVIHKGLEILSAQRSALDAGQRHLSAVSNVLGIQAETLAAAARPIRDAGLAQEVVALNKFQVLNQSGLQSLRQAHPEDGSILRLLH
jgi:flagellin-like hook-associated protein FlgL